MKHLFYCCLLLCAHKSFSQTIIQRDPEIEKMVKEVSPDSLRSYIKTLVAFGTRNTLSTQTDPNRGIGAARNWVLGRFNEMARHNNHASEPVHPAPVPCYAIREVSADLCG